MSGPSLHRPWSGPRALRSTIPSSRRLRPIRLAPAHLAAFLLFGYEHALAVSGPVVPVFGRASAEIIENENAQRRGQRAVPASSHIAANIVRRTEFAMANFDQGIPYLRFEADGCPASLDAHIAQHECAVSVRAGSVLRADDRARKGRSHGASRACNAARDTKPL